MAQHAPGQHRRDEIHQHKRSVGDTKPAEDRPQHDQRENQAQTVQRVVGHAFDDAQKAFVRNPAIRALDGLTFPLLERHFMYYKILKYSEWRPKRERNGSSTRVVKVYRKW